MDLRLAQAYGEEFLDHWYNPFAAYRLNAYRQNAIMATQPVISLKCQFVLTSIAVVCLAAISTPSPWPSVPLIVVVLCVNAYGLQRLTLSPISRPFWVSYFGGIVLLVLLQIACAIIAFLDRSNSVPDPFSSTVTFSAWDFVTNGEDYGRYPLNRIYQLYDLDMRIIATTMLAFVTAYIMTFFSGAMSEREMH